MEGITSSVDLVGAVVTSQGSVQVSGEDIHRSRDVVHAGTGSVREIVRREDGHRHRAETTITGDIGTKEGVMRVPEENQLGNVGFVGILDIMMMNARQTGAGHRHLGNIHHENIRHEGTRQEIIRHKGTSEIADPHHQRVTVIMEGHPEDGTPIEERIQPIQKVGMPEEKRSVLAGGKTEDPTV